MNVPWPRAELTYCSNVHPGANQAQVARIIDGALSRVRRRRGLDVMAGGLWFSRDTAGDLLAGDKLGSFAQLLERNGIRLFTLNGFPAIDFHSRRVKQAVYRPDWADAERLDYTLALARILAELLDADAPEGTISTVPLGFAPDWNETRHKAALQALCRALVELDKLYRQTGKRIRLCLEMEPGCALQDTDTLIGFFRVDLADRLQSLGLPPQLLDDHLGICFDVCHQAVMFEDIYEVMQRIQEAGIVIAKIQLSSALQLTDPHDNEARATLAEFAEPRYLHQSCCRDREGRLHSVLDLDEAFTTLPPDAPWRVHFHVPIQAESLICEGLGTTQREIGRALDFLRDHPGLHPHLEVETYTWGVLPRAIRPADEDGIVDGLAAELFWLEAQMQQRGLLQD